MKFKVSIGDYSKMIKLIKETAIIGFISISVFTVLVSYEYFKSNTTMGIVLLIMSILIGPLYLLRIRYTYANEDLELREDCIVSSKFGIIEYRKIKSFKIQKFSFYETLILRMNDNSKIAISSTYSFKELDNKMYSKFKNILLLKLDEENKNRIELNSKGIKQEKSFLQFLGYILYGIIILMTIIFLIHKLIN